MKKSFLIALFFILAAGVFVYAKSKDSREPLPFGNILTTVLSPIKIPSVSSSPSKDSADIQGTWKLSSFRDLNSGEVETQPEMDKKLPAHHQDIAITFKGKNNKGTLSGHTINNTIFGNYELADNNKINMKVGGTKISEPEWGKKFWDAIHKADKYRLEKDSLFLYYNNSQNLMEFVKIDQ